MKIWDKKKLLELLDDLTSTLLSLEQLTKNSSEFAEICALCQEIAIDLGNFLEEDFFHCRMAVSKLEGFCEIIYKVFTSVSQEEPLISEAKKLLKDVKSEIKKKYTIVFLPYKASMWDSLESIWWEAKQDQNCICYMIPIPYYTFADKEEPKLCYEGSLFPEYIEVQDYLKISLAAMRPDVIYIHNPFDNQNRVTSIHPEFYSSKLKQYTEMLVYVPYYLTGVTIPQEHLVLPAYENANKIVVQNDIQKKQLQLFYPETKILAIGNPKVDKLLWLKNHKQDRPLEWKEQVGDKKLIMYNVSLHGFLHNNEQFLMKMKYVFQTFAHRDDVALLFRPHPLLEDTIHSMRPGLFKMYQELINWFMKDNIGILDKSSDPAKSAVHCSAYIGEGNSSIAKYFGVLCKPVFQLDPEIIEEFDDYYLEKVVFYYFVPDGDTIWFVDNSGLGELCQYSLKSKKIEKVIIIPETVSGFDVSAIQKEGDIIYLIPKEGTGIYKYNIIKDTFEKLFLKKEISLEKFVQVIKEENYLYLIPYNYSAIVKYDIEKNDVIYDTDIINQIRDLQRDKDKKAPICRWKACIKDNMLYIPFIYKNMIAEFGLKDKHINIYQLEGLKGEGIQGIRAIEDGFIIYSFQNNAIYCWKKEENIVKCITENNKNMEFPYLDVIPLESEEVIAMPFMSSNVRIIHLFKKHKDIVSNISKVGNDLCYTATDYMQNKTVLGFYYPDGKIHIWNKSGLKYESPCHLEMGQVEFVMLSYFEKDIKVDSEQLYYTCFERIGNDRKNIRLLSGFLDYICQNDGDTPNLWEKVEEESYGWQIYHKVLEEIELSYGG